MIQALVEIALNVLLTVVLGVIFVGIHLLAVACHGVRFILMVGTRVLNRRLSFKTENSRG